MSATADDLDEADLIDALPLSAREPWLRPLSAFARRVTDPGAGRRYG